MYKRLFLLAGVAILAVLLWSLVGRGTNSGYAEAKEMLLFRRVGHEFLLSSGDKKSRVMPVKKLSDNEWRIEFENPFAFYPDSLIAVVTRVLNPMQVQVNYIVNVTDRESEEVVYSFSSPAKVTNAPVINIACAGRPQPSGKYVLNILFSGTAVDQPGLASGKTAMWASAFLVICLGIFAWRFTRRRTEGTVAPIVEPVYSNFISIGKFRFYPSQHLLLIEDSSVEMTAKEAKLLRIFCDAPNEVIDRNQLLKEGWEDEGVITGRSLDMYVSKLRKKLQADPAVGIINVHGKGYRLNC
jgi:hypothetical protein